MEKFGGECVGGPIDGKLLVHWARTKKFYRPMVDALSLDIDNTPVEAIEIGEYRLNDYGHWHWWPTEAGRAMDTLHGEMKL
jgi:hypothetical protein